MTPSQDDPAKSAGKGQTGTIDMAPGQVVSCLVNSKDKKGYWVSIAGNQTSGVINTAIDLTIGSQVQARFICMRDNTAVLSIEGEPLPGSASKRKQLHMVKETESFHKRAADLVLPPFETKSTSKRTIKRPEDLTGLILEIEEGDFTGSIRATSERWSSRSVMLLLHGTAIGAVYGCAGIPDRLPTLQSIQLTLSDLSLAGTEVVLNALPDEIVLSLASLFLGYPIPVDDSYKNSADYVEKVSQTVEKDKLTGCLAITSLTTFATQLGLYDKGECIGVFDVETQTFSKDPGMVKLLIAGGKVHTEFSVLPPEVVSDVMAHGHKLSKVEKK
jgi:hypothetical protein